jgi:hypothetical protein
VDARHAGRLFHLLIGGTFETHMPTSNNMNRRVEITTKTNIPGTSNNMNTRVASTVSKTCVHVCKWRSNVMPMLSMVSLSLCWKAIFVAGMISMPLCGKATIMMRMLSMVSMPLCGKTATLAAVSSVFQLATQKPTPPPPSSVAGGGDWHPKELERNPNMSITNNTPERKLLLHHLADLAGSGLDEADARAYGLYSEEDPAEIARLLGWGQPATGLGPCLVFPYFNADGTPLMYRRADGTESQYCRLKPDRPREDSRRAGRGVKYESPVGGGQQVYIPRGTDRDALLGAAAAAVEPEVQESGRRRRRGRVAGLRQLLVVEGEKKALAAHKAGYLAVGVPGTWGWVVAPPDDVGPRQPGQLREVVEFFRTVPVADRAVFLVFDSDAHLDHQRHQPVREFAQFLLGRGARVHDVQLPLIAGMTKTGADDYLRAPGFGRAGLNALMNRTRAMPAPGQAHHGGGAGEPVYEVVGGATFHVRQTQFGAIRTRLSNFAANIVTEVTRDDGQEQTLQLELGGRLDTGEDLRRVRVSSDDFNTMAWVTRLWGGRAIISAGQGTRDRLREAIQTLSPEYPRSTCYCHTGWRQIDGRWAFLHAGGAIGAADVEVDLGDGLGGFRFPTPPAGDELVRDVLASLRLLDLAPDRVSFPGLASVYRVVLGATNFSIHVSGTSGIYKTELIALWQQHFGLDLGVGNLPANWSGTANSLEAIAFTLKDAVMATDDWAPNGGRVDLQKFQQVAERLLRGVGNRQGRSRARPDGTVRPTRFPRALVFSTGEDIPPGHSLRARFLPLPLVKGDIPSERLTACQADAKAGRFAGAMAGFINWLVPQYGSIDVAKEVAGLRASAGNGQHSRTPDLVANMTIGLDYLLRFAQEVGAIDGARAAELRQRGAVAFAAAVGEQTEAIQEADSARLFLRLLDGVLTSGVAYLEGVRGGPPENPLDWGWVPGGQTRPGARFIGWVDEQGVYLQPEAAFAVAQHLANAHNTTIPVGETTLWKRLREGGFLASWDATRQRNKVRKDIGGVRGRYVIHLRHAALHLGEVEGEDEGAAPGTDDGGVGGGSANATPSPGPLMFELATSAKPATSGVATTQTQANEGVGATNSVAGPVAAFQKEPDTDPAHRGGYAAASVADAAAFQDALGNRPPRSGETTSTEETTCTNGHQFVAGAAGVATQNIRDPKQGPQTNGQDPPPSLPDGEVVGDEVGI